MEINPQTPTELKKDNLLNLPEGASKMDSIRAYAMYKYTFEQKLKSGTLSKEQIEQEEILLNLARNQCLEMLYANSESECHGGCCGDRQCNQDEQACCEEGCCCNEAECEEQAEGCHEGCCCECGEGDEEGGCCATGDCEDCDENDCLCCNTSDCDLSNDSCEEHCCEENCGEEGDCECCNTSDYDLSHDSCECETEIDPAGDRIGSNSEGSLKMCPIETIEQAKIQETNDTAKVQKTIVFEEVEEKKKHMCGFSWFCF